MSKTLGTNIEGLSNLYFLSKKKLSINSTCTVFAESEVISLLSSGQRREDVAAAIINCICKNVCSLAYPLKGGKVFVCGGVAKNAAVIEELRRHFSNSLWIPPFPEFVAATGAALSAG
jgi:activator of 2-hydroxyglutaryl-CoA dehydratase